MARTKASVGAKLSSGKSNKSRCGAPPSSSSSAAFSGSGERSSRGGQSSGSGGGNSVCPRETPKWQLPITNFFCNKDTSGQSSGDKENDGTTSSTSKLKPKHNVIQSDDEEDTSNEERPKNKVLDETIELEPLTGEDSHKIEEYYTKNDKHDLAGKENGMDGEGTRVKGEENGVNGEGNEENDINTNDNEINAKEKGTRGKENGVNNEENAINGKKQKGKGTGKKTNKENVNANSVQTRKSVKRDLEEVTFGEDSEHVKKKKKID